MITKAHRKLADFVTMLLLFAVLVGTASAYNLTCHCRQNAACHTNGFCANGCEEGWHGPGCQVGNVALGKTTKQSTTLPGGDYGANLAVDGIAQTGYGDDHCAHTDFFNLGETSNGSAWWVVTLDVTRYFFITNITIVNRKSYTSNRLSNFIILYSNDTTGDPDPRNSTWCEYAEESGTFSDSRTYPSNTMVVAKRVAVYLTGVPGTNPLAILTLCEVFIYGYEYYECLSGFTGPGCLLRSCDQCASNNAHCTGDFDSCRYDVCPEQSLLPPDCWITLGNLSTQNVLSKPACNSVLFSIALPDTQPNSAASSLLIEVTTTVGRNVLENATRLVPTNSSASYNLSGASAGTEYTMSLKVEYCGIPDRPCHNSTGIQYNVRTGVRQYIFTQNASCVFVSVTSTTTECELLSSMQLTCASEVMGVATVNSSGSTVCGLERGQEYNCSVAAIVNAKTIERHSEHILIELFSTVPVPNDDISILAGSIGGCSVIVLVIVAIIVIYFRLKRVAGFHGTVVKLDAKPNDPDLASTLGVSSPPSLHKDQYDNHYESLHKDMDMQTIADYASL